jgi:DNA polymerase/3'-5' exonuclease PolX
MSTNTTRIPLKEAVKAATAIVEAFTPVCDKIVIAGSVRRREPTIGDLELVLMPHRYTGFPSMFDDTEDAIILGKVTEEFIKVVNTFERLKGQTEGRYLKLRQDGLEIDVFMPQPHDLGRILAIRTGSADYSAKVIAGGWGRLGWVGTNDGLRLASECVYGKRSHSHKWVPITSKPTLPPVFTSEELFFDFLEIPWIEPSKRNV